jgi:peroxiredoxin (alkyl hydroperoxide reductase subunit C)
MQILRKLQNKRDNQPEIQAIGNPLPPGTAAPDFVLPATVGDPVRLSELNGRPVILAFYPADNSPVCSSQLALYNEALSMFEEHNAQLFGISIDDIDSHKTFADSLNLTFPLLVDNDPSGRIARAFGVFDEEKENSRRALFVLDAGGIIRWHHISPDNINPGADGILRALEELQAEKSTR